MTLAVQVDQAKRELVGAAVEDALATQDDELDRHPVMLPLVRFIEKAAMLAGDGRRLFVRLHVAGLQVHACCFGRQSCTMCLHCMP